MAGGFYHSCAVTGGGGVLCWGDNVSGQLGNGTTTDSPTPVAVNGLSSGVVSVTAGVYHTCALTRCGAVLCWGLNDLGQLGDGTTTNRLEPVTVTGLTSGAVAVSAHGWHTCALTSGGAVRCWGLNGSGQLGDGTTTSRLEPVTVTGLASGAAAVEAGEYHTCALTVAGGVQCWGLNDSGQLGDGTTVDRVTAVTVIGLAAGEYSVAGGEYHTCALTGSGGVQCWGRNLEGQLGDGTTTTKVMPVPVSGLGSGVAAAATGYGHSCALTSAGAVLCWGDNGYGQLGDGTTIARSVPVPVSGLESGTRAVVPGAWHTCALTTGGAVACWGYNAYGQLGDGTRTNRSVPITVTGLATGVESVSASRYQHACALLGDGSVRCWGVNSYGALGDGTTTLRVTPVVVGVHRPDGDVDGNGTSDVVWRHATRGEVWLWSMAGTTVSARDFVGTVADANWMVRALPDQTFDGRTDLLWRHATTGQVYLWRMNGATVESMTDVGAVNPAYDIVGTLRSIILWRHTATGELWAWTVYYGELEFTSYVATIDPAYVIVGSGDLNADGNPDLVWRHATTGDVWVWLMDWDVPISQTYVGTVPDTGYQVVGVADYTGDGKDDLLWRHATTGDVWVWQMDGTTIVNPVHVATVSDTNYRIVGSGDYDGDGRADVLWHHATRGEVWVWLMNGGIIRSATWVGTVGDVGYQVQGGR